jgi:hypothetical protein
MAQQADRILVVRVIRSGGFAGISREWTAEAREPEAEDWVVLVESCPWRQVPRTDPLSRDRFVWRIEVRGLLRRSATLPDAALDGPWRTLVERVQVAGGAGS